MPVYPESAALLGKAVVMNCSRQTTAHVVLLLRHEAGMK